MMAMFTVLVTNKPDGNGCSIFTSCPATAKTFQDQVDVGQVGINVPVMGEYAQKSSLHASDTMSSAIRYDPTNYK